MKHSSRVTTCVSTASRFGRGAVFAALMSASAFSVDRAPAITLSGGTFPTVTFFVTAPSNLQADQSSGCIPRLTWRDNSSNESGFEVQRSRNGGAFLVVATLGPNTTIWSPTSLGTDTYRVRAFRTVSGVRYNSAYSNLAYAAILATCF